MIPSALRGLQHGTPSRHPWLWLLCQSPGQGAPPSLLSCSATTMPLMMKRSPPLPGSRGHSQGKQQVTGKASKVRRRRGGGGGGGGRGRIREGQGGVSSTLEDDFEEAKKLRVASMRFTTSPQARWNEWRDCSFSLSLLSFLSCRRCGRSSNDLSRLQCAHIGAESLK